GEQIVARLKRKRFAHDIRHLAFPNAGHGIAAPPGEPLTAVSERLGGTVSGNAQARDIAWPAVIEFLAGDSTPN
ncbi:MAG: dienelactone hydrolase, partial [Gammaproteobacteria bacterium]|nr:dienelactone hydrolase [Gammaproteobacteria bacterium]